MAVNKVEKRACASFSIPGATVYYRKEGHVFSRGYSKDFFPVIDISRGGLCFLSHRFLKIGSRVALKILAPDEEIPLVLKGTVTLTLPNPEKSYKCQAVVHFSPYGRNTGENAPECLDRIAIWEEKFIHKNESGLERLEDGTSDLLNRTEGCFVER